MLGDRPAGVQLDILNFLKSYNDFSSTSHLEGNLMRNLTGMANAMPASWGDQLRELIAQLENGLAAGDRQGNISLLQQKVFPLMSAYVSQTHDLGTPRELLSLLALDLARYENGSEEKLAEAFHQLSGYGTLKGMLGGIDSQSLMKLLQSSQFAKNTSAAQFADHLAAAASRALRGGGKRRGTGRVPQSGQGHAGERECVYAPEPLSHTHGDGRQNAVLRAVGGP